MATEIAKAAVRQAPAFKLGQKQVFLPNHVITLLRKEHLPPNEACFKVPLRFTKFDLRDYLWNLYNVETKKVRSYVKEQPLTQRDANARAWYRPQPHKIMTVELSQPFQWPDLPTDVESFNTRLFEMRLQHQGNTREEQIDQNRFRTKLKSQQPMSEKRKGLADVAKAVASGEVVWNNGVTLDPRWDDILAKQGQRAEEKVMGSKNN